MDKATVFSFTSSCIYSAPFLVIVKLLGGTPLLGVKIGRPFFALPYLNPYPQPVQVLGADIHKIPILPVLHAGRILLAAREYLQAVAAMQAAIVIGKVKANVVTVGQFIENQGSLFHKIVLLWVFTGFRFRCRNNNSSRQTSAFSAQVHRLPYREQQGKCNN